MTKARDLHEKAMEFYDEAFFAKRKGDASSANKFSRKALELEIQAAEILKDDLDKEPSRSVLYRSAALIAIDCKEYSQAEELIETALAGNISNTTAEELRELLKRVRYKQHSISQEVNLSDETNYVFIFGKPYVGKTVITTSIINYLSTESRHGLLRIKDNKVGITFLDRAINFFRKQQFPERTVKGSLTEVDVEFLPFRKTKDKLALTFLEMSGEDLRQIEFGESSSNRLPTGIEVFLRAEGLSKIFILVTSHDEASNDDYLMAKFLDYIIANDQHFQNSRVLLLVSKWDTFIEKIGINDFLKSQMPLTYRKLHKNINAVAYFSIGKVSEIDGMPFIIKYDSKPAEKVFSWIYKTLTGKSLTTFWDRLIGNP